MYVPTTDLHILLQENMWTDPGNIHRIHPQSQHMNIEIGTEAVQFPDKEYKKWDFRCSVVFV
jgi:hypothetical protein